MVVQAGTMVPGAATPPVEGATMEPTVQTELRRLPMEPMVRERETAVEPLVGMAAVVATAPTVAIRRSSVGKVVMAATEELPLQDRAEMAGKEAMDMDLQAQAATGGTAVMLAKPLVAMQAMAETAASRRDHPARPEHLDQPAWVWEEPQVSVERGTLPVRREWRVTAVAPREAMQAPVVLEEVLVDTIAPRRMSKSALDAARQASASALCPR